MQMQLPIFPNNTKLINAFVGVFEKDDFVYYLHNGTPIFIQEKNDLNNFRYITANLVATGLCSASKKTPVFLNSLFFIRVQIRKY